MNTQRIQLDLTVDFIPGRISIHRICVAFGKHLYVIPLVRGENGEGCIRVSDLMTAREKALPLADNIVDAEYEIISEVDPTLAPGEWKLLPPT